VVRVTRVSAVGGTRAARAVVVSVAMLVVGLVPAPMSALASAGSSSTQLRVGTLTLTRCQAVAHAWCGRIKRPWDPSGEVKGNASVGFAFVPASDQKDPVLGTVVPHDGGPGYSTTGSRADYAGMYGALLKHRNMLLFDQRGTGLTAPLNCPGLQNLHGPYDVAAAKCGRALGNHSDLYGSTLSADDLSAVISDLQLGKVALYGDSYGTFFTQVFAGRHPSQVSSIVLDSAYPPTGESAWYPTQTQAMRDSLDTACRRTPACASAAGTPVGLLRRVLAQVRRSPYRGIGYDADGVRHHAVVTGAALVGLAFGATYGPAYYREFAASMRAALHGDRAPLLRLIAETNDSSSYAGIPTAYSEGLDAAVTCQDYPQLFDMSDPPAQRLREYKASVRKEQRQHPRVYAPFTIKEYLHSVWEEANWCLKWPSPSAAHPAGPPAPPSGHYPSVPTLVLSGELDSITTPAEGALVAAQFPGARQVIIANSFHVTAEDDTDGCGSSVLRHFVTHPRRAFSTSTLRCTHRVPPLRALDRYRTSFTTVAPARRRQGNHVGVLGRRAVAAGAGVVADLIDRWFNNYSGHGVGLYGGTWHYGGSATVTFHVKGFRLERNLAVSGLVRWSPTSHRLSARLRLQRVTRSGRVVHGSAATGTVNGHWNTRRLRAVAHFTGRLGGRTLRASTVAP
jgi:pimeloyl-ACP methyl ester carboxylesterase